MKRFICVLLLLFVAWFFAPVFVGPADADWRWADPKLKSKPVAAWCESYQCIKTAHKQSKLRYKRRVQRYHDRKQIEWMHWTAMYIPDCTWYGESGTGAEYARYRYILPNSTGSGAYGKFQFMPGTYHANAKYHDWSALDQEIAARREYWKHDIYPWQGCTG